MYKQAGLRIICTGLVFFLLTACSTSPAVLGLQRDDSTVKSGIFPETGLAGNGQTINSEEEAHTEELPWNDKNLPESAELQEPVQMPYSGYDKERVIPIPKEGKYYEKIPVKAKGIYVTGWSMGGEKYHQLVKLVKETELNSMVIDVKDDTGYVTYPTSLKPLHEVGSDNRIAVKDLASKVRDLNRMGIYTIARVVVFKDPYLPGAKPEWALQKKEGGVWRDSKGVAWVDPYRKEVWDYNIAIAKEAAELGFREIQFDYVRFPENGKRVDAEVVFQNPENRSKEDIIADFLIYAKNELATYPVFLSADVFGLTTSVNDDMGIGQKWEKLTSIVDYMSPMMYPSHYANQTYDLPVPDSFPYETIDRGIQDAIEKNLSVQEAGKPTAIIRPWLQDFTATWVKGHIPYHAKEVRAQIEAAAKNGVDEYLIWNPGNRYSEAAWRDAPK